MATASPTHFRFEPISVAGLRQSFLDDHEHVLRSSMATMARSRTASRYLVEYADTVRSGLQAHDLAALGFVRSLRTYRVVPNGHPNTPQRPLSDKGMQFIAEVPPRSIDQFAMRNRRLPPDARNPLSELRLERLRIEDAKPIFVFDAETELQFLKAAAEWEFAIHFTRAKTGLRPGELCHLLVEDLDLAAGWLHVRNQPELDWSVKTRNERSVPLVSEVTANLHATIGDRPTGIVFRRPQSPARTGALTAANRDALGKRLQSNVLAERQHLARELTRAELSVIAKKRCVAAGALDPDQIRRSYLRIARRCGLPQATCSKSWRHSFVTLLQDANVDPLLRQITLGHQPAGRDELQGVFLSVAISASRAAMRRS
ncbi:tyrosine-type recombinase/integrase [Planctellipticum variicoloris]|uniref:tyrosine-type recombinase/integrase n=1 Tax=Planctellipticum variicoloris TaxID=3064265 RepID=UPI003013866B|nr:tyrosine-type recombinase/integrase [Planctomycetaceae bacterium SH412]